MLDTVRTRLREIYDRCLTKHHTILNLFIEQFGEDNVDCDIPTFEDLIEWLNSSTLGSFLSGYEATNSYGHYHIDPQDYDQNGRGKPFLEYIPDLGILDFITPNIRRRLFGNIIRIIVHFPRVRVTNEFDKFIDIQDLYALIKVNVDGTMYDEGFKLARTTYPYKHFNSGYAHSHLPRIDSSNAGNWLSPCLGLGPIRSTISTLCGHYDEQFWGLFTFELSKYVTIESLTGGPYIRLETVGRGDLDESIVNTKVCTQLPVIRYEHLIKAFIRDYAHKHKFKFKFVKGQYQIGENPASAIISLSNAFIDFLNDYNTRIAQVPSLESLKSLEILKNYIVAEDAIYNISSPSRDITSARSVNGRPLFRFKGHEVQLNILLDSNINENYSLLFTKSWYEYILTKILEIINSYGKTQNQISTGDSTNQSDTQGTPATEEKPYII